MITVSGFDVTALHAARDAAGIGGVVNVPNGNYTTTIPLLLNIANQRWELEPNAIITNLATNQSGVLVTGVGVVIRGGIVDGNKGIHTSLVAAIVLRADRVALQGVEIRNGKYYGVLANGANYMRIVGCYVHDNGGSDIWVGGHATVNTNAAVIKENIVIASGSEAGIEIRGNPVAACQHTQVIANHVNRADIIEICIEVFGNAPYTIVGGNTTRGGWIGISVDKSDGTTVVGNTVVNTKLGIEMAGSRYTSINGNTVDCNDIDTSIGITCSNLNVGDVTISGNAIRRAAKGIHLNGTLEECEGFTIAGNTIITNNGICIHMQNATDVVVSGNRLQSIDALVGRGIVIENSDYITLVGNNMRSLLRGIALIASNALKAVDYLSITANSLRSVATPLIQTATSGIIGPNIYIKDNAGLGDS